MKKIKILHIFGKMDRGGAETLVMNIFRNIDRNKFQFDFAVNTSKEGDYDHEIKKMGGNIFTIKQVKGINRIPFYKRQLKNIIEEKEYDVVHSHVLYYSGITTNVAKKAGVKTIISHSHNIRDGRNNSILRKIYKKIMTHQILKNSTHLFSCSKDASFYLFGTLNDNRIIHINNGIDIEKFKDIKNSNSLLKELEIPEDAFVVGHIGRFHPQKNHEFLINIFNKILGEKENSYLILVGRGELEKKIKEKVTDLGIEKHVKFLGVREDIPRILKNLDVFILPSLYEGLGIVLIEAQAAGVPCFVSDTVPKDANMDAGLFSTIQLSETDDFWANKILESNLRKKDNALNAIINKGYSIKDTTKLLEKIYNE